jgi:hypothetical protein
MNTLQRVYLVVLAVLIAIALSACSDETGGQRGHKGPKQTPQGQPRAPEGESAGAKPGTKPGDEFNTEPRIVPKGEIAEDDVKVYYDAAARGDYDYTYGHLSQTDRLTFTKEDWVSANQNLQSDQASYQITDIRKAGLGGYDVELTVDGKPRKTTFVSEGGEYKHELSNEEYAMFAGALYSASASASAGSSDSASASASASESASASPNPNSNSDPRLHNGKNDLNCDDLSGRVKIVGDDEDQLDRDHNGWGCE